jgi:Flp pilus assembly protein RcpC/CpaB
VPLRLPRFEYSLGRKPRRVIAAVCLALAFASATGAHATAHRSHTSTPFVGRGRVAVPVSLHGVPAREFLRAGDHVDLLVTPLLNNPPDDVGVTPTTPSSIVVAEDLVVLSIPTATDIAGSDDNPIVVAATREQALRITSSDAQNLVAVARDGPRIAP